MAIVHLHSITMLPSITHLLHTAHGMPVLMLYTSAAVSVVLESHRVQDQEAGPAGRQAGTAVLSQGQPVQAEQGRQGRVP